MMHIKLLTKLFTPRLKPTLPPPPPLAELPANERLTVPHFSSLSPEQLVRLAQTDKVLVIIHPFFQAQYLGWETDIESSIKYLFSLSYAQQRSDPASSRINFLEAMEMLELHLYLQAAAASGQTMVFVLDTAYPDPRVTHYLNQYFGKKNNVAYISSLTISGYSTGRWSIQDLALFTHTFPKDKNIEVSGTYYELCGKHTYEALQQIAGYPNLTYALGPSYQKPQQNNIQRDPRLQQLYQTFLATFSPDNPLAFFSNNLQTTFSEIETRHYALFPNLSP